MNEPGFELHPLAARDITEIWEYIAEDNPAARRVREDILDAIRALIPFPHQGHRRPDLTSRPLRFKRVRDYLIAYAPDEKPLRSEEHTSELQSLRHLVCRLLL